MENHTYNDLTYGEIFRIWFATTVVPDKRPTLFICKTKFITIIHSLKIVNWIQKLTHCLFMREQHNNISHISNVCMHTPWCKYLSCPHYIWDTWRYITSNCVLQPWIDYKSNTTKSGIEWMATNIDGCRPHIGINCFLHGIHIIFIFSKVFH